MFLFYVLSFFKKGDTIQGGTLFKGGHYLRKYGIYFLERTTKSFLFYSLILGQNHLICKWGYFCTTVCHKASAAEILSNHLLSEQLKLRAVIVLGWNVRRRFEIMFFDFPAGCCTMVFCYQNCSDLLWEKIVLVTVKNF